MATIALHPLSLTPDELAEALCGKGRAHHVWRALRTSDDLDAALSTCTSTESHRTWTLPVESATRMAHCGTTKSVLTLNDGAAIETVVIPNKDRSTVCVSTQVGCIRGCRFCVTATMGLHRNLRTEEIVAQVLFAMRTVRRRNMPALRNVVFMGMGEPLDNFAALAQSLQILTHPHALALAPKYVTVSTVGTAPGRIRAAGALPARLAWSLHSANDTKRRFLVPTAKVPLSTLREAFVAATQPHGKHLFVEITLIRGINDSEADADEVAAFLQPLQPGVRVNILPLNRGREGLEPSSPTSVAAFQARLRQAGYLCFIRAARGQEEQAACGQLITNIRAPTTAQPIVAAEEF